MIAKILAPSTSFNAIAYNEKKVREGSADRISIENFGWLENIPEFQDENNFRNYLIEYGKKNANVEKQQFHACISIKGKYLSSEQLTLIAKDWLKQMGYEGVPTVMYFHNDTKNNHIHIITSRVGLDGKKINDSNERWRARSIIVGLSQSDTHQLCRDNIAKALTYRFDSIKQYQTILISMGYKSEINNKNNELLIFREGLKLHTISLDLISNRVGKTPAAAADSRKKQIKALFYKYSKGLSIDDFKNLMKEKFGLSIIFFGKKDSPFGYSVVDHVGKSIYKGGDIMNMQRLFKQSTDYKQQLRNVLDIELNRIPPLGTMELNHRLKKYGAYIKQGEVIWRIDKSVLFTLNEQEKNSLKTGNLICVSQKYNVNTDTKAVILSQMLGIDISLISVNRELDTRYKSELRELIINAGGSSLNDSIESLGLRTVYLNEERYLVDDMNFNIYSFDELNLVQDDMIALYEKERYIVDDGLVPEIDPNEETAHLGGGANNELPKKRKR